MTEAQASDMIHYLELIARRLDLIHDLMPRPKTPCPECNGNGKFDGDVTYGDGVMAIERDCAHCNGTGVEQ